MMTTAPKSPAPFPTREQILEFIHGQEAKVGKREIARAFHLDADQKVELRRVLKDLEGEGAIERGRTRRFGRPGALPSVGVIEITGTDTDGEILGRPYGWTAGAPPRIHVAPDRRSRAALGPGDRILARLRPIGPETYEARLIRRLMAPPPRTLGVLARLGDQTRIQPIDRRVRADFIVTADETLGAEPGELVWAEVRAGRALGLKSARVVERLGPTAGVQSITPITIHDHDVPSRFSEAALHEAAAAGPAPLGGRTDLRDLPLVTIDGADARDFDDAVWAEPDLDGGNPGGWHLVVAIADVAWYVRPGSGLDRTAFERGNSVYFPDRVVPMLPEPLSNGWCSLKPGEDRSCLAAHLWIDAEGTLKRHRFVRGMMRSAARLTYTQVQTARDGRPDETTGPLMDAVIQPLYGAFAALIEARSRRGVLELDVPERRVLFDGDGKVAGIEVRERFDSHKLIEEFMILANVAAAETLEARKMPCMYRVHDQPSREKMEGLREFLDSLGIRLARAGVIRPRDFNRILERVAGTPQARLINEVILRSQAQAVYDPQNIGHFGLALLRYCHFTSPIRRYADLLVHRALITAEGLGEGGFPTVPGDFERIAEHISGAERRAAAAERDAVDRFTAAWLAEHRGSVFRGRISGVTRFGLFVTLDGSGADGLVPVSTLPDDYYVHDEGTHQLVGRNGGLTFRLGDHVEVRLVEANPLTGGILFEVLTALPERGQRRRLKTSAETGRPSHRRRHRTRA
jgi:ribonuclease R